MHGEQFQAEQDAAAHIPEVPVFQEVSRHHKWDGGEVEQVCHSQVDDGDVHGGGEADRVAHHHKSVDVPRHPDSVNNREQGPESGGDDEFMVHGAKAASALLSGTGAEMRRVVVHPV